jgi:hypothetical protein
LHYIGLDLGKQHDFTALTVVQPHPPALHIVHLHRYPLGTDYTHIADDLAATLARPPLAGASILGVDATGLGGPFLDLLRERMQGRAPVIGITITGDRTARWLAASAVRVPKSELVRTLVRLVEQRRLHVASALPLASLLVAEMRRFKVHISQDGRVKYAADFGAGENDDLVLSAMYACWLAENVGGRHANDRRR